MNHTTLALLIFSVLCSVESNAQEIIHTRKLAKLADTAFRNLDELNALVFEPDGYERVLHPKLPDSLSRMSMLSKEERAELREKRKRFNPYLTFDQTIVLRQRNIFIGLSEAFIK